jgi:hypothetical protein
MALVLRRTALFLFIVVIWAFFAAVVTHASSSEMLVSPDHPSVPAAAQR